MTARPNRPTDPVQAFSRPQVEVAERSFSFFGVGESGEPKSSRGEGSPQELKMKSMVRLLVVLVVLTLGTTTLATTVTAGESDGVWGPRGWDGGGGVVYYGDPDGGGPSVSWDGTGSSATTYRNSTSTRNDLRVLLGHWLVMTSHFYGALVHQNMRLW